MKCLLQLLQDSAPVRAWHVFANDVEEVLFAVRLFSVRVRASCTIDAFAKEDDREVVSHLQRVPSPKQLSQVTLDETFVRQVAVNPSLKHLSGNLNEQCKPGTSTSKDGLRDWLPHICRVRFLSVDVDRASNGSV